MSLTVTNQAADLYNQYKLQNSETYKNNAVDASAISKENYNVSNITNAMDALVSTDKVDLNSVGNIGSYASSQYEVSQLANYDTLSAKNNNIADFLPGSGSDDSLTNVYNLIAPNKTANAEFLQGVVQKAEAKAIADNQSSVSTKTTETDSSRVDSYSQYLSGTAAGSLLDTSV